MTIDYVSNEDWIQTHQAVEIASLAGSFTLRSDVPNGTMDILSGKEVAIKSACSRIVVSSDVQESAEMQLSGSVELYAQGDNPVINLAAVSSNEETNGSSLKLAGGTAGLLAGKPGSGSGLTISAQGANLSSVAETLKSGISITPQGVVIQVGETSVVISADGILLVCGDTSFNLTANSIVEAVTAASSRSISSTGHTLVGASAVQMISAESRLVVTPEGVTTTAATNLEDVDATKENQAAGITAEFDAETSLTSSLTTIE